MSEHEAVADTSLSTQIRSALGDTPTDNAVKLLADRVDAIAGGLRNIPTNIVRDLIHNDQFFIRLAAVLKDSDSVVVHPTATVVEQQPAAEAANPSTEALETPADEAAATQTLEIIPTGIGEASIYAAQRCDSTHPLFPNQFMLFGLMENQETKAQFWQLVNPDPNFIPHIAQFLSQYPYDKIVRFNVNISGGTDTPQGV